MNESLDFRPPPGGRQLRVGILGASGHAGGELCRLLLQHPGVASIHPSSRTAQSFDRVHPNLMGSGLAFVPPDALERLALDLVFFCTPSGEAMRAARAFLARGIRVVDLGPDFRFRTAAGYEAVYGRPHADPALLDEAVYGATELNRARIRDARLVANPGCYALATLLAIAPAVRAELIDASADLHVHAINGTTGASSTPAVDTHHARAANGLLAYSLAGHRHGPELEHQLSAMAGRPLSVVMNTAHGPFPRGIQVVVSAKARPELARRLSRRALTERYLAAYGEGREGEYFVVVNAFEKGAGRNDKEYHLYPNLARVAGSNFCHVGLDYDEERSYLKVVSAIDNLGKGAAGSAVQNMNTMFGFEEASGLRAFGL